jgi:hypothetical protein
VYQQLVDGSLIVITPAADYEQAGDATTQRAHDQRGARL